MVDVSQAGNLSNRGSVTPELVGVNDFWDIVFTQQPGQEGLRRFGVPMPLEENVKHETVLVHGPPKPIANTVHARTHLVEMPPGTPSGFPVAQFFDEERSELYAPFAEGLAEEWRPHAGRRAEARPSCPRRASVHDDADLNAALVQQFLHVSVT